MMNELILTGTGIVAGAIAIATVRARWRHEVLVQEGHCALVFRDGRFVGKLERGFHVRWGRRISFERIDLRRRALAVPGQEILTADNVSLKISGQVTWQVVDAEKTLAVQFLDHEVYNAVHQSMRTVIGSLAFEEVMTTRAKLGPAMLERVAEQASELGVRIHILDVRDVMLPGDLRKAYNEVLKARQEGQAALERARGESAALRNLANAARLMNDNPALMNLRVLQTVNDAKEAGNNTLVMGLPGGFVPFKE